MNLNHPVRIPEIPGKITFDRKNDAVYVRYLLGRKYDKERKFNIPEYKVIGVQIERVPTLMLPNENYEIYFDKEGNVRAAEQILREAQDDTVGNSGVVPMFPQDDTVGRNEGNAEREYMDTREIYLKYKPFFTDLFYEIRTQSRKNQDGIVRPTLMECLKIVLTPLREMLAEDGYAEMLGEVAEGVWKNEEMTYGELMGVLTNFKCALGLFQEKRL